MCFLFPFFYFISPSVQCKTPFPVSLFFYFSIPKSKHTSIFSCEQYVSKCLWSFFQFKFALFATAEAIDTVLANRQPPPPPPFFLRQVRPFKRVFMCGFWLLLGTTFFGIFCFFCVLFYFFVVLFINIFGLLT